MKHKYTAYFDDSSALGRKIIAEVEEKRGAERQNFLRELAHIGYVAKLAGFGEFNGHLVTSSGNRVANIKTSVFEVEQTSAPEAQTLVKEGIDSRRSMSTSAVKNNAAHQPLKTETPAKKGLKSKLSKL